MKSRNKPMLQRSHHRCGTVAPRRLGRLLAIVASVAVLSLSAVSAAGAFEVAPELLFQIPAESESTADGSAAGQLAAPGDVTTNAAGTRVYVPEGFNNRISVFSAWGTFIEAFGWGVRGGAAAPENCTTASGCRAGIRGSGPGQFDFVSGIVADAAGNLYVSESQSNRVQKLSPTGEFLAMFGGGVDKTTDADLCTKADVEGGDVCGAGTIGIAPGDIWGPTSIEIGPNGDVYVGEKGRIQIFAPEGTYKSEIPLPNPEWAVGDFTFSGTRIYADFFELRPNTLPFSIPSIYEYSGGSWAEFASLKKKGTEEKDATPADMAAGPEGELYVLIERGIRVPAIAEYAPNGAELAQFGSFDPDFTASGGTGGLATNWLGDLFVATRASGFFTGRTANTVTVYGPGPVEIEEPPVKEPTIVSQYAAALGANRAVLKAQINPHFFASTTYYLEYGLGLCSSSACTVTPAPPGVQLPGGQKNSPLATNGVVLSGLIPETTYHYRFTAISGPFTVTGPDRTFTTRHLSVPGLSDGRAWEKVSPADKNSGDVGTPQANTGGWFETDTPRPQQAATDGEAVTYPAFAAFGDAAGAGGSSQYLSRRTASGWETSNITPPNRGVELRDPLRGFSPDLSVAAVAQSDPPLLPGATPGVENLYLENTTDGSLRLLTTGAPQIQDGLPKYCTAFFGASDGFKHVIFSAAGGLTPEAPVNGSRNLYEWVEGQGLRLVNVLPDGSPAVPSGTGAMAFGASGNEDNCGSLAHISMNAISRDGSTIFWTDGSGTYEAGHSPLFARLDGRETVELDSRQGGAGPTGGGGRFWAATPDGNKVLFSDANRLLPGSKVGDLYLYDFKAPEGERLSDITTGPQATETRGVLGTSTDLSRIYFVGRGILTAQEENGTGEKAVNGARNLYLWEAGRGIRFITILAGAGDISDWGGFPTDEEAAEPQEQTARVTPDGQYLAFLSTAALSGYENIDQGSNQRVSEAYLYDAVGHTLVCASCNPTAARPTGASTFPTWRVGFQQPRFLSDDGSRLFFESADALAPDDANGKVDVYEFERTGFGDCSPQNPNFSPGQAGCISLLSGASSTADAYLMDASPDGRDVFFSTSSQLLPSDQDGHYDVYDARVGGGFAEPAPPAPCSGEGCRNSSAPSPATVAPGSAVFSGPGNARHKRKHHHHRRHRHKRRHGHHHNSRRSGK